MMQNDRLLSRLCTRYLQCTLVSSAIIAPGFENRTN